jgi:glycosyltransferase involved in cell wall biosynthesis
MALEAIESVMRQQYSKVEIILVDDGSTDNTIAEVASQFPATHIITRHDVGPGQARNAGVAASKGDILMFLDSDDIWLDNHVQQLVDVLNRGFQVAYGVAHTKNMIAGADFLIPENGTGIEGDCFDALLNWCFLVPSAMAIQREAQFPFGFAGPESITLRRLHSGSLCFLSDKKKLLVIIRGIFTFLKNEPRATASHLHYFKRLHDWTVDNNAQWSTVQEWYLSMLQEKII